MNDPLLGAYEQRLLVFLENPEYDGFRQVILDAEQFKKVSDAIFRPTQSADVKPGFEVGEVELDGSRVIPQETFEGMSSCA
jgi:hypothetical protein